MRITIEKIHDSDAKDLYEFELENRAFFEELVPSRGDEYYHYETFLDRHTNLLKEQSQGSSYFYLIKDETGTILGRMNLVDIDYSRSLGHIGYRVGRAYTGKGIAQNALNLLIEKIPDIGIKQLMAKTTTNNIASQKVLEKYGFKHTTTGDEEFIMNGQRVKFLHYIWDYEETKFNEMIE